MTPSSLPDNKEQDRLISTLRDLVARQLTSLFSYSEALDGPALEECTRVSARRALRCFSFIRNKYFHRDGKTVFDPYHSGQYCMYLYFLSNTLSQLDKDCVSLADRVYYLNKALNGVDMYHEVVLPPVFGLDHPLGSVLGRATYGDFFTFAQQCTVGNNHGIFPRFGRDVRLLSGAKVLGDCAIGDHVIVSANCFIKDTSIPSHSIVFGSSPHLTVKAVDPAFFEEVFESRFFSQEDSPF